MLVKKPCNSFYNFAHCENFKRRLGHRIGDKVEHMSGGVMRAFVLSLREKVVLYGALIFSIQCAVVAAARKIMFRDLTFSASSADIAASRKVVCW
jgi:hypothetical protein